MNITDPRIDSGKPFDWGRTSEDYAKYRDIYPEVFYRKILSLGLCRDGQRVLDLGTGTGVLPRHLTPYGAVWTASDISSEQIREARRLSAEQNAPVSYLVSPTEELSFPDASFDVITACQCFWYFDHQRTAPMLGRWLTEQGKLLVLYMAWLPYEDEIAGASEALVLRYHPTWSGAGERVHPIEIPPEVLSVFTLTAHEEYRLDIPFTRESWHGRMRACRGVGASLSDRELRSWEQEHLALLERIAPERFTVRHYAAYALLEKKPPVSP